MKRISTDIMMILALALILVPGLAPGLSSAKAEAAQRFEFDLKWGFVLAGHGNDDGKNHKRRDQHRPDGAGHPRYGHAPDLHLAAGPCVIGNAIHDLVGHR